MKRFNLLLTTLTCAAMVGLVGCEPASVDSDSDDDSSSDSSTSTNDPEALADVVGTWEHATSTAEAGSSDNNISSYDTYHIFTFNDDYTFSETAGNITYNTDYVAIDSNETLSISGTFTLTDTMITISYTEDGKSESVDMEYKRLSMAGRTALQIYYYNSDGDYVSDYFAGEYDSDIDDNSDSDSDGLISDSDL